MLTNWWSAHQLEFIISGIIIIVLLVLVVACLIADALLEGRKP